MPINLNKSQLLEQAKHIFYDRISSEKHRYSYEFSDFIHPPQLNTLFQKVNRKLIGIYGEPLGNQIYYRKYLYPIMMQLNNIYIPSEKYITYSLEGDSYGNVWISKTFH